MQTVEKLPYTALRREFRDGIDELKELVFLKVREAAECHCVWSNRSLERSPALTLLPPPPPLCPTSPAFTPCRPRSCG